MNKKSGVKDGIILFFAVVMIAQFFLVIASENVTNSTLEGNQTNITLPEDSVIESINETTTTITSVSTSTTTTSTTTSTITTTTTTTSTSSSTTTTTQLTTTSTTTTTTTPEEKIIGVQIVSKVNDEVKDNENNTVGKKIEDEPDYETFFTFIDKEENNFVVRFYHNATNSLPVWVEGDIDYDLSSSEPNPLEEVNLTVPLVDGNIPRFRLHVGYDSDIFEFGIIITKAMHLDKDYKFILDIYNEVKSQDGIWSEKIYANEYVRIKFEKNLTNKNDITVYTRNNQELNTHIEVYYEDSNEKIAEFPIISNEGYYKIFLTSMTGVHDTFDLKIVGEQGAYLEFDYIVDPLGSQISADAESTALEFSGTRNLVRLNNGKLVGVWESGDNNIICAESSDDGKSWTNYKGDNGGTPMRYPSIATNGTRIYIVADQTGQGDLQYAYNDGECPAASWTMTDITGVTDGCSSPSIEYDGINDEYVMCFAGPGDDAFYAYMKANATDSWTRVEVEDDDNTAGGCGISVNTDGSTWICYDDATGGISIDVWNSTDHYSNKTLTQLHQGTAVDECDINARDQYIAVVTDGANSDLYVYYSIDWGSSFTTFEHDAITCNYPTVCIDSLGRGNILWWSVGNPDDIYYENITESGLGTAVIASATGDNDNLEYTASLCHNFPSTNNTIRDGLMEFLVLQGTADDIYFANYSYTFADTTPPIITIQSPQNRTYSSNNTWFNATAVDNIRTDKMLVNWGTENKTMINATGNWYYQNSSMPDGTYTAIFYANDTSGNENKTNVTFTIDTVKPNIQLNSPINNLNSSNTTQVFNFTVTDNLASSLNCNLTIDGSVTNSTTATNNTPKTLVNTLTEATHLWNVTCEDSANNINTSETRRITIDATKPFVSIILPANTTYNSTSRTLNYTAIDSNLDKVWYDYNGTNTTLSGNISFTALDNQISTLTLYANDTAGNVNSTSVTFTVDTVKPQIELNLPADDATAQPQDLRFNFTAKDNIATSMICSIYIDNVLNQTNSSTQNNTLTNFNINGISEGLHYWNVTCNDTAGNVNTSSTRNFTVNVTPILTSITATPSSVKGGSSIYISPAGIGDPQSSALYYFCSEVSTTPNSSNNVCSGNNVTTYSSPYSSMNCSFTTSTDDTTHTIYCRVYDGTYYSSVKNTTYTTDSTSPTLSIVSVAGDATSPYYDNVNDEWTNITVSGEASMLCRWEDQDHGYSSMPGDAAHACSISGTQATCSPQNLVQSLTTNLYVSCKDSLDNENNATNNLDIFVVIDWTVPTTTDNSSSTIVVPPYVVNITESDNLYGTALITTKYCTDTTGTCTPNTEIDHGGSVTFTSSNSGQNFFRYNSSDPAGNVQTIQNKTININQLPTFTSATDGATTIKGGATVTVSTVSSDADSGQTLKLYICNSTSVSYSGCTHSEYCSNTSASANASCSFTSETDDTTYTWYAFIYDSLNEAATANYSGSYTTDSTPLVITIIYPENTTYSANNVTAAVSLVESGNWSGYCLDDCASNVTMTRVTATYFTATMTGLSDGSHRIIFFVNDSVGNMENTSTRYFTVDTTIPDTTSPTITINSPTNGTHYTSTSVWANITINENATAANYSLDGGSLQPMSNTSTTKWYEQLTSLSDETYHNLTFYANDTSNNQGNNSVSFYVDTIAPRYSSVSANPNPANESQAVNCSAYWTDGISLSSGKVAENSGGSFENHTVSLSGTTGWANYTILGSRLSVGSFTCIFYATDLSGNENSTNTTFTVQDVTAPTITITSPSNATYAPQTLSFDIVLSEAGKWANYSLNNEANISMTNTSLTNWNATNSSLTDGTYVLRFYAADYSDNIGTNNVTFTIQTGVTDTIPPAITVNYPSNNSNHSSTWVWLNITLNEEGTVANYTLNEGSMQSMDNTSTTVWYKNVSGLSDEKYHNITIYANDTSKNRGNTSISIFVDTVAPKYSNVAANPSTANESQSVTCSAYWTDAFDIHTGKVAENSTGSFVNHTTLSSDWTNYTISGSDLSARTGYVCKFYAKDYAGNWNSTETSFTVQDVVTPTITIASPTNTTYSQNWVTASITLSESGKWANYSLDGNANESMTNSSLTQWSATVSSLSNAVHTLTFYAADYSDNVGTKNVTFTIDTTTHDTTPPIITVWSPTNGTYYTSSPVTANITLNEAGSSATYSVNETTNVSMNSVTTTNWDASIPLSDGEHNVTFYANDTSTNKNTGASSTIYFTVDTSTPQNTTQGPSSASDIVSITCYSQWTDNLGLDYGYLEHNATGTSTNSSQISLSGTSGWVNATIAASDTDPGMIQCKAYVYDKAGLVNTSAWLVDITDATNPVVENITYAPNTTDDLDPSVMVNVTANVSDNGQLSSVILQYKLTNESTWNTSTMNLVSGNVYTGNFTPTEGNWSFRINATDSYVNENISDITNISVALDKTWVNITTIPSIKAIVRTWSRVFSLGNLTINNTGDYDLNFTLTSDSSWITFNGTNTSLEFILNQTGNSTTFNVTANTTGFAVGEYTYTITINSYTLDPTLVSISNISGTVVIQNVAGPYFDVKIITYDSDVTQGQSGISLKSSVENAGTGYASSTWLAWTLPSGWSVTSGTANVSVDFLGVGEIVYNLITVDVSSSANTGEQTLMASAGCLQGVTDDDTKTVTVSGVVTTTTTVPSTVYVGGGGGGASTAAIVEKILLGEEVLTSSETFELVRGYSDTFPVSVKNIFEGTTLYNISIKIEGYLSQYMTFSPSIIDEIEFDETKRFDVTIVSPEYMERGTHELTIVITGKIIGPGLEKDLTETRSVTLVIHTVSEEEASKIIELAISDIKDMESAGFPTSKILKILEDAKKALEEHDYENAKDLSETIRMMRQDAFKAHNIIQEVKSKMKRYVSITGRFLGVPRSFPETEDLVNLAMAAFEREDYETAIQRGKDAQLTLALESGETKLVFFLIDYWWVILLSMVLLSVGGFFGYQTYVKAIISQRIRNLEKEEETIRKLMKETQKKHFKEKTIGPSTFRKTMSQHQKRLSKVRQLRTKLRHKRLRLLKPERLIKDLEEERKDVIKLLKNLQSDYFVNRKVSKAEYDEHQRVYNERLAEIEGERLTLETKLLKKDGKKK